MALIAKGWHAIDHNDVAAARSFGEKALAVWPESSDATLLIGHAEPDPLARHKIYARAVELAAARVADSTACVGRYGEDPAGVAVLRALGAYARSQWSGQIDGDAFSLAHELLALDPNDPTAFARELISWLVQDGELEQAHVLVCKYEQRGRRYTEFWPYIRALIAFAWIGHGG